MGDVSYIEPAQLYAALSAGGGDVLVLDVRDEDAVGGKIRGAVNVPSEDSFWTTSSTEGLSTEQKVLAERVGKFKTVVCHCAFSKQRGPACARALSQIVSELEKPPEVLVLRGGYNTFASDYRRGEVEDDPLFENS